MRSRPNSYPRQIPKTANGLSGEQTARAFSLIRTATPKILKLPNPLILLSRQLTRPIVFILLLTIGGGSRFCQVLSLNYLSNTAIWASIWMADIIWSWTVLHGATRTNIL